MSDFKNQALGRKTKGIVDTGDYKPYIDSGGKPQMGFSILRKSGRLKSFYNHDIRDLDSFRSVDGSMWLVWTHDGTFVMIKGTGMRVLQRAMLAHTLIEIWEPDGRPMPEDADVKIESITLIDLKQSREVLSMLAEILPPEELQSFQQLD